MAPNFLNYLDPIFVVFACLYGFLAISSALVWRMDPSASLRQQIFAWWRIFPIATLAVLLFPYGINALFYLVLWLVWRELTNYADDPKQFSALALATLVGYSAVLLMPMPWQLPVQCAGFVLSVVVYRMLIHARKVDVGCWLLALNGLGFLLTVASWAAPNAIATTVNGSALANLQWAVLLFVLTALNDVAQFIAGKCFGKHCLAPMLSPNKTWQGALGGVMVTTTLALVIGSYWQLASTASLLGLGVTLAIFGIIGDLSLSYAKRQLGVKDFSQLIPGHGGILDRVDSLIFTTPVVVLWAQLGFGVV